MSTSAFPSVYHHHEDWFGARTLTSSPEAGTGYQALTGGVGTPTATTLDGANSGILRLTTDGTSGASWIEVNQNNIKGYMLGTGLSGSLGGLRSARVKLTPTGSNYSASASFYGMSGNHNATLTSMVRAGFEITGGEVFARTFDGTTDSTAIDTGYAVQAGVPLLLEINFENPLDVKFYATNPNNGTIDRLCRGTTFSMAAVAGTSLQECYRHGISAGNAVITADIDIVAHDGRRV